VQVSPNDGLESTTSCKDTVDLSEITNLCQTKFKHPKLGYLNINTLQNKIVDLRSIIHDLDLTFLAIAETKLNESYPNAQFFIDGYNNLQDFRRDRVYNNGGGLLVYIKKGIPCKRLRKFESDAIETVVVEIHLGSKKWCIVTIYRNEDVNPATFLENLSTSLDRILDEHENVIIIGDININSLDKSSSKYKHLKQFCESYSLSNLIKQPTCFQSENPTSIDLILTNKKEYFMHTKSIVNGLSDHHSIVMTMLKTQLSKIEPTEIKYRSFKDFDEIAYCRDLGHALEKIDFDQDPNDFTTFSELVTQVTNEHCPIKTKIVRGNDAPFMTKELRRAIMHRSKLKNKLRKENTPSARKRYKVQRNKCTKLRRENISAYFKKALDKGPNSKSYWKEINPFLTDKGSHGKEDFILEENNKLIKDPSQIANMFVNYYTNILEISTGKPPVNIPLPENEDLIDTILSHYENHTSINAIKEMNINSTFEIPLADEETIERIMKKLDTSKATGIDNIPVRLVVVSSSVTKKALTKIINKSISKHDFPNLMQIGKITPIYKGGKDASRLNKKFFRPVSVLIAFSKVFERYILEKMLEHVNLILSDKISAYRKGYSTQHVLLKLTEEWRKHLDSNKVVGAVLMDLSKAFDCIPHELLIAKLSAYGFEKNTLKFFLSYLKGRKQTVNIKGNLSSFMDILAGVPQGSILGPVIFNIFINDMHDIFERCELRNFADDNTLDGHASNQNELIENLEFDSKKAIKWFEDNHMIANPDKFKAIIIHKDGRDTSGIELNINNEHIKTSKDVILLGISIDNKLSFIKHISKICKSAANQLNSIKRLKKHFDMEAKRNLTRTFVLSQFNYCPLVWHFCGNGSIHKMEKIQERVLRFVHNDYETNYKILLERNGESTLYLKRVRLMAQEVYKALNNQSPKYAQELLHPRHSNYSNRRPLDLYVPKVNQTKFGYRSYTFEAPSIWNSLPLEIRKAENFELFKTLIKKWTGSSCRCKFCDDPLANLH
tara:strand:- start:83 stop:3097 length:3015 start_codon:yes stop_codon:yes gene_type:complete